MSKKQMEGDNQRRRALARESRQQGRQASGQSATLGSSKQTGASRAPSRNTGPLEPSRPRPTADRLATAPRNDPLARRYQEVVGEVSRRIGVGFDEARSAAEATVTVTARALGIDDRQRFLDRVPGALHENFAVDVPYPPRGLAGFVEEVGRISHQEPEVARIQAQAVLSVLAEEDRDLLDSVFLPEELRGLLEPPPAGGGLTGPGGVSGPGGPNTPLSADELRDALEQLPYWNGTQGALRRTISLPADNLDRVLARLDRVRGDGNRTPKIIRDDPDNATIVLRSANQDAVTALDVDMAGRVDAAIEEAGGGMAAPR